MRKSSSFSYVQILCKFEYIVDNQILTSYQIRKFNLQRENIVIIYRIKYQES